MEGISEAVQKAAKRQKVFSNESQLLIDNMMKILQSGLSSPTGLLSESNAEALKKECAKMSENGKEFQNALGKATKSVEKKFKTDLDGVWDPKALEGKDDIFNQILMHHFVREGRFDLAQLFSTESSTPLDASLCTQFMEMFHISSALRESNADAAIKWTKGKGAELAGSSFEFRLHQFKFLSFVNSHDIKAALAYSKSYFPPFAARHIKGFQIHAYNLEIQQLMCCILFHKRLANSPYQQFSNLLNLASSLRTQFSREFSQLLGQSFESPLFTSVSIGSTALPMILKLSVLMKDKSLEWTQQNELAVTLPLLEKQRFHSIFVCPVSKEPGTEQNPPMMMVCGHVLSRESLTRLSKGSPSSRFKCPYCPVDSTAAQAIRIYF